MKDIIGRISCSVFNSHTLQPDSQTFEENKYFVEPAQPVLHGSDIMVILQTAGETKCVYCAAAFEKVARGGKVSFAPGAFDTKTELELAEAFEKYSWHPMTPAEEKAVIRMKPYVAMEGEKAHKYRIMNHVLDLAPTSDQ